MKISMYDLFALSVAHVHPDLRIFCYCSQLCGDILPIYKRKMLITARETNTGRLIITFTRYASSFSLFFFGQCHNLFIDMAR